MFRSLLAFMLCCCAMIASGAPDIPGPAGFRRPQLFMENKGQIRGPGGKPLPQVLYHLVGNGINISLTANSIQYTFIKPEPGAKPDKKLELPPPDSYRTLGMEVSLAGANANPRVTAEEQQPYYENHFTAAGRMSNIRSYARIVYHEVYPHIDWVVYLPQTGGSSGVKYDFVVRPGGDPAHIRLNYSGAASLSLTGDGGLTVRTALGTLQEARPYSYVQESGAVVASRYKLRGNLVRFAVRKPAKGTLIIDPQVRWATYFGGDRYDAAQDVSVDGDGAVYLCGLTGSIYGIATSGSHQSVTSGGDAFLAKFSASGSIIWATFYGGTSGDFAHCLAIDTAVDQIYIGGYTTSDNGIATVGAHKMTRNGSAPIYPGVQDAFIAKFDASGVLIWGTYYGGNGAEEINSLACDAAGNLYAGGVTSSDSGIATSGIHKPTYVQSVDSVDGFLVKFDSSGSRLWGTYFGGELTDHIIGICTDRFSNVFATGFTISRSGVASIGSHQSAYYDTVHPTLHVPLNKEDAFLAKFSPSGARLWSTYFGGSWDDYGQSVTCDSAGNVYMTGITWSQQGMATAGAHQTTFGGGPNDAFIAKFSPGGVRHWSTYYGGTSYEGIGSNVLIFDFPVGGWRGNQSPRWNVYFSQGRLLVGGLSASPNAIASACAPQPALRGALDAVVASFDTSGRRLWSTYFGGNDREYGNAIVATGFGEIYLAGTTASDSNLATGPVHQTALNYYVDAFLTKLYDSLLRLELRNVRPAYCAGESFSVRSYITNCSPLAPGNVFRVELSNASGSFSAPVTLGTLTSVNGAGIACVMPAGISGAGYKLRVVSTNPAMISDAIAIIVHPQPQPVLTTTGSTLSTGSFAGYQWYRNGSPISGATAASFTPTANGQYTVTVTDTNGCKGSSVVYAVGGVGIAGSPALTGIRVYPNPANDHLVIEGAPTGTSYTISTVIGQQLVEGAVTSDRLVVPIGDLPAGAYLLGLQEPEGGRQVLSLVKQ